MSAKVKVEKVVEIMEEYLSCRPWEDRDDYWLEFHYNENYLKSGASIGELLYHKIYNVYNHYLRGKLSLEDEIEMTGDVFGYDKYKRYYYIWSMNTIFTRGLDYVILPAKDSSNKDVNLFSSELKFCICRSEANHDSNHLTMNIAGSSFIQRIASFLIPVKDPSKNSTPPCAKPHGGRQLSWN